MQSPHKRGRRAHTAARTAHACFQRVRLYLLRQKLFSTTPARYENGCKAYKRPKGVEIESRGETPVRTKQRLAQTRAGQTRGLGSRSRRHRPPRERWEEARGGRQPQPTMEETSRQTTQGRRRGGGAGAQGETREGAGLCGDQQEDVRRGAAGTRGAMWKTASSPPPGGRPRLVADHTHKK